MSNDFVAIDSKRVDEMLATLSDQQTVNDILNEGLEQMANVYYNEVLTSLRREMGTAADTSGKVTNAWHTFLYPLSTGIAIHPDPQHTTYGVHGLKDPRLLFFEGGTKQRYTKGKKITGYKVSKTGKVNYNRLQRTGKGGYRGFIKANNFFTKGITSAESTALDTLTQTIINAIRNKGIDIQ